MEKWIVSKEKFKARDYFPKKLRELFSNLGS